MGRLSEILGEMESSIKRANKVGLSPAQRTEVLSKISRLERELNSLGKTTVFQVKTKSGKSMFMANILRNEVIEIFSHFHPEEEIKDILEIKTRFFYKS
jgi:ribosome-associated translation inhibitor RaiA